MATHAIPASHHLLSIHLRGGTFHNALMPNNIMPNDRNSLEISKPDTINNIQTIAISDLSTFLLFRKLLLLNRLFTITVTVKTKI